MFSLYAWNLACGVFYEVWNNIYASYSSTRKKCVNDFLNF